MAPVLGKRKRRDQITIDERNQPSAVDNESNLQALFQQHFESTFEPLPSSVVRSQIANNVDTQRSDEEVESDWDGFSDSGEEHAEVVQCAGSALSEADISRDEFKTFMSTKPPTLVFNSVSTAKRKQLQSTDNDESSTDAADLKKDLALQRLLKESHLLDSQSSLSHSGLNRHKALDLRLQDMGSKSSVFSQQKMPFTQRKGIAAKATRREELRRQEAKENGIILEKVVKRKKKDDGMRLRGIGAPSVGKFQGGMLKLSQKDVAKIEGPKKFAKRKR